MLKIAFYYFIHTHGAVAKQFHYAKLIEAFIHSGRGFVQTIAVSGFILRSHTERKTSLFRQNIYIIKHHFGTYTSTHKY